MAFRSKLFPVLRNVDRLCSNPYQHGILGITYRQYWGRRDLFSELSSAMQVVENRMRDMDREMNRVFGDVQRSNPLSLTRLLTPFDWIRSRDVPIITTENNDRLYRLEVDMQGLQPEDISITLKDNILTIRGRKEDKKENSQFVREYCYQYNLPENVNPDTVRSLFNKGVLTIEAPLPEVEEVKPKEIPIQKESSSESKE